MATSYQDWFGDKGNNQVDLIDVLALMTLPITSSMLFGVFTFSIDVFGGYDMTDPIWTVAGADLSAALFISLFSIIWILVTNVANSNTQHSQAQLAIISVALILPLLTVFVPAFHSLVFWSDLSQLAAFMYVTIAATYVSYIA